jgi:Uma2 family endonuclease
MAMPAPEPLWIVNPERPRAPPDEIWDKMSPEERRRVVDALPSEFEIAGALPPEGDLHFTAKIEARDVLGGYFQRVRRSVYIGNELAVYYPGEDVFAPDVIAVLDVGTHSREKWVVREEGKGVDFAMEIIVHGNRRKDLKRNVERYARLGISEYFVFDRGRLQLTGHRLPATGARSYEPILPRAGLYTSHVLGLDVRIEGAGLRFYHAAMALPDSKELIGSLERIVDDTGKRLAEAEARAEEEARRAEEEARRAEEEARRAEEATRRADDEAARRVEAERKLAEALAELERLAAERPGR